MSIILENECVGCPPNMGCLGDSCPKRKVAHYYCDKCDADVDPEDLYEVDGVDLCVDCLKDKFRKAYY